MKIRHTFYLTPELSAHLDRLAKARQVPRTEIIEAAIASLLSPDADDRREAAVTRRLDQISRQLQRLERDTVVLTDTLALFIQFWLTATEPIAPEYQAEARAKGNQRFEGFTTSLARRLQQGRHFKNEIPEDITPR